MTTCDASGCHLPAVARVTVQLPGWRAPETRAVCAAHHRQLSPPASAPIPPARPVPAPIPAPETKEAPMAAKTKTKCCMPGCSNKKKAKWLCNTHYRHLALFPDLVATWPTVPEGEPTPADKQALSDAWEQRDMSSPVINAPEPPKAARKAGELLDTLTKERDTAREKAARLEDACRQWEETNRLQRGTIERLQKDISNVDEAVEGIHPDKDLSSLQRVRVAVADLWAARQMIDTERKAAMKLVTEHERLQGEHEALAAERDQLASEHETLTTELEQAHEDVDSITRLVTDLAVRLVGPTMADKTTSHQLKGLHGVIEGLRTRVAVLEGEVAHLEQRRRLGPQKSQRDPDGPGLVDPTAALLLLDFARDLAGELDGEMARAVYHAIGGAQGALREQAADSGVRGAA